jgi:alcohol dehydrogenase class IV
LTNALCLEGIQRAARSLKKAYEHGDDAAAREDMCVASLFGGLALANAKLGAVHGFAAPLGGMFSAPHGAVCARLLPFVMETNILAIAGRLPDSQAYLRYTEIARILTGNMHAGAEDGVDWVRSTCAALQIPPLSAYGITPADFPDLIKKAAKASSMQGNPVKLTPDELQEILAKAL